MKLNDIYTLGSIQGLILLLLQLESYVLPVPLAQWFLTQLKAIIIFINLLPSRTTNFTPSSYYFLFPNMQSYSKQCSKPF